MRKKILLHIAVAAFTFAAKIASLGWLQGPLDSSKLYWVGLDALLAACAFLFCRTAIRRGIPPWMGLILYLLILFNPYTYRLNLLLLNEKLSASLALALLALLTGYDERTGKACPWLFSFLLGLGGSAFFFISRYPAFAILLLAYGCLLSFRTARRSRSWPATLPAISALLLATTFLLVDNSSLDRDRGEAQRLWAKALSPSARPDWDVAETSLWKHLAIETLQRIPAVAPPGPFQKTRFEVSGWVFGVRDPIVEISLRNRDGKRLAVGRNFLPRPDVTSAFQGKEYSAVPPATGFHLQASIPYYASPDGVIFLTDASGREYQIPAVRRLSHQEAFVISVEKSEKKTVSPSPKPSMGRTERLLSEGFGWISSHLIFFLLAAFPCLLIPQKNPASVSAQIPAVLLLTAGALLALLQIPFAFLPGNSLVRPQEVFLVSLFYPSLAALATFLACRKFREASPDNGKCSPVKYFLTASGIFGVLLAVSMPPFQAADEGAHFFKAYQVSEWNLRSKLVPPSLYQVRDRFDHLPFFPDRKTSVREILTARHLPLNPQEKGSAPVLSYSPFPYLPSAAGILVGRSLDMPPLYLLYIGRICALLAYMGLVALAIRWMPVQKWLLALFALMPMSMAQAAAVTADTVTLAMAYLFLAYVLRLSQENGTLRIRQWLSLAALLALISLTKPVYCVFALLFLLIPPARAGSPRRYWIGFLALLVLSGMTAKGWIEINQKLLTYEVLGSEGNRQLSLILDHPTAFLRILGTTVVRYGTDYLEQLIGRLGWLDTALPGNFRFFYGILLLGVAIFSWTRPLALSWFARLSALATVAGGALLIAVSLFLTWTPIGSLAIEGIQGRYFLPLLPPLLLMLYPTRNLWVPRNAFPPPALAWSAAALGTATTLGSVIIRYYLHP